MDLKLLRMFVYGNLNEYNALENVVYGSQAALSDKAHALKHIDSAIKTILVLSQKFGFYGNLWHCFIAYLLSQDENPYSLSLEMKQTQVSPVQNIAHSDLKKIRELFLFDFNALEKELGEDVFSSLNSTDFSDEKIGGKGEIGKTVSAFAAKLEGAANLEEFILQTEAFYRKNGVGMFALNKAFRLKDNTDEMEILPIYDTRDVCLDDLWGYDIQKKEVKDNTDAFVKGRIANNCLLYGDAGTGKSTMIKAILNEYFDSGLRMVEVYKHQFKLLSSLIQTMKSRNYCFIIYMDDLSFEEFEIEYKYLKAVIEGGLEERPKNILIYATSNRRHLVKESWKDRDDMDMDVHRSDTMSEKLSLSARFGVAVNFSKPNQNDFFSIVYYLAEKNNINMSREELEKGARIWGLSHGGLSGRAAQQYINYILSAE